MKKVFIATLLLAGISLASLAQVKDNPKRSDRKHPAKELNLTEEQQQKMKELRKDFREKSSEMAQEHRNAMKQILTPEQQSKWEEMQKNRPNRMQRGEMANKNRHNKDFRKGGMHHRHDGRKGDFARHGNRHFGKRNLSDETLSQLDKLEDNFFQQKQTIKKSRIAPEEQKRQLSELRTKYRTERMQLIKDSQKQPENDTNS
ncbi:Spy/CpxP family protein refolding chaperone [Dysgonomonas sp. 25]|uniref:Spy/CpxP family protein refolding chaperone n=1 Tax=Dysgonomonas sp. 25 TaxID=2302933 RepID=UPI0013D8E0AD|nr:hypothetical protein [Dysgonomonas sp. 25]NDV67593.1 hypothetical protein [Dysgonomonas sp. 25]